VLVFEICLRACHAMQRLRQVRRRCHHCSRFACAHVMRCRGSARWGVDATIVRDLPARMSCDAEAPPGEASMPPCWSCTHIRHWHRGEGLECKCMRLGGPGSERGL